MEGLPQTPTITKSSCWNHPALHNAKATIHLFYEDATHWSKSPQNMLLKVHIGLVQLADLLISFWALRIWSILVFILLNPISSLLAYSKKKKLTQLSFLLSTKLLLCPGFVHLHGKTLTSFYVAKIKKKITSHDHPLPSHLLLHVSDPFCRKLFKNASVHVVSNFHIPLFSTRMFPHCSTQHCSCQPTRCCILPYL